jgi:hypothetical protein
MLSHYASQVITNAIVNAMRKGTDCAKPNQLTVDQCIDIAFACYPSLNNDEAGIDWLYSILNHSGLFFNNTDDRELWGLNELACAQTLIVGAEYQVVRGSVREYPVELVSYNNENALIHFKGSNSTFYVPRTFLFDMPAVPCVTVTERITALEDAIHILTDAVSEVLMDDIYTTPYNRLQSAIDALNNECGSLYEFGEAFGFDQRWNMMFETLAV